MSGFAGKTVSPDLLRRAQAGDRCAQAALFEEFGPPVFSLAARITGSRVAADDVLQDSFVEILRNIQQFRGDASLATWIRRIAVSRSLMYLRTAWQRRATLFRDLVDDQQGPWEPADPAVPDPGLGVDLDAALATLSDISRVVVVLHDVEGYTHAEIAARLGMSPSFSKSQLARARVRLRDWLRLPADSTAVCGDRAS